MRFLKIVLAVISVLGLSCSHPPATQKPSRTASATGKWVALETPIPADLCPPADHGIGVTVARLTGAEEKFYKEHGRYGTLLEMTDLDYGLPLDVTSTGRLGPYRITIRPTKARYVLRAIPVFARRDSHFASFYADETGGRSKKAGSNSTRR